MRRFIGICCFLFMLAHISAQASEEETKRAFKYDSLINLYSRHYKLSFDLVKAVIWRESDFNPYAVGKAGEVGLMQVTKAAAADWAKAHGVRTPSRRELFDPSLNIRVGTWYLARAKTYWSNQKEPVVLALCEYNAGRKGTKQLTRIKTDGSIAIRKRALHYYVSSVIQQYYKYLSMRQQHNEEVALNRG